MNLSDIFFEQSRACQKMGSDFVADLLSTTGKTLKSGGNATSTLLNAWQGEGRGNAGNLPLRFAGALHALVLQGEARALSLCFPPHSTDDHALRNAIEDAVTAHKEHFDIWLRSAPQTNELQRSALLIAAGHMIAAHAGLPLVLSELGASGGLNLNWDQYALRLGDQRWGPENALFELTPRWDGAHPIKGHPIIKDRAGVDLNPLDPRNPDDYLRLQCYIWPDQAARLERLAIAAPHQHTPIAQSDAAKWLEARLQTRHQGQAHVIYHTVFWQYLPQDTKDEIRSLIEAAGAKAGADAPLYWLSFEEDYSGETGGAVDVQFWPEGTKINLGRADFHTRWVQWRESSLPVPCAAL